jgi:hypothetical protein
LGNQSNEEQRVRFVDTFLEKTDYGMLAVGFRFRTADGSEIIEVGTNS